MSKESRRHHQWRPHANLPTGCERIQLINLIILTRINVVYYSLLIFLLILILLSVMFVVYQLLMVFQVLFAKFQKGIGDTSENGKIVLDNCMQLRFIACSYPAPFHYVQEDSRQAFGIFQSDSRNPLKGFVCGLSLSFDYPLAFASPLGELLQFELN